MRKALAISMLLCLVLFAEDSFAQKGPKKDKGNKENKGNNGNKGNGNKGNGKHSAGPGRKGGGPPPWAPAHGYRAKTRHVFFKDYDTYYDLAKGVYITLKKGKWEVSAKLPAILEKVDLKKAKQVELELDMDEPQKYFKEHKGK